MAEQLMGLSALEKIEVKEQCLVLAGCEFGEMTQGKTAILP